MVNGNNTASDSQSVEFAHKGIRLRKQKVEEAKTIEQDFELSPVASRILAARGYTSGTELKNYIRPTLKEGLPAPEELKNLNVACALIVETIKRDQSIAICCDFDVDGLSGAAQLYHFLKTVEVPCQVYVPDRFKDGYGLNQEMIKKIAEEGHALVVTIDYGTTNIVELELAHELGLKTIVVDHHHTGDVVPPADVFVNPHQKGCGFAGGILCAAGLAWYLVVGLRKRLTKAKDIEAKSYLDLACLGTICDMVPLIGANRIIAKRGLEMLERTNRKGLVALKEVIGVRNYVRCSHVSFGIGPRINAAGRMVHGDVVIDLLSTSSSNTASKIAKKLNKLNIQRQETEETVKQAAILEVQKRGSLPCALVVGDASFHTGVVGIVAQRLVEAFYRPSVVLGFEEGAYKGSVRGIKGFNVVEALTNTSQYLIKFGGHAGAGGCSIAEDQFEAFTEAFIKECERQLKGVELEPHAEADTKAKIPDINIELIKELKKFEPFGIGNPAPLLLINNLEVVELKVLKSAHLKTVLTDGKNYVTGLMWRQTSHPALEVGSTVNIVCRPDSNVFNGRVEMQAVLQAVELSDQDSSV
ncbi:single-stranded-DNA-specific exonuclease RecJ [Oligoflexia bacterium]|nr:single-stranded-DNA-specific exonuclease RecJ [Oligoflexia bacterium]